MEKYRNIDILQEALLCSHDTCVNAMVEKATSGVSAVYYIAPYFYCAAKNERVLPLTVYKGDKHRANWEKVCFKQGRTLYRCLDGNKPPDKEPLDVTNTTFEWFIGPLSDFGDAND